MTDKIEIIQLQFQARNARKHGATSSDQINDTNEELAIDLATMNSQWNDRLVPLTISLPNGTPDTSIDAFTNGLDGANLYVDQDATVSINSTYFNSANTRPNSVLEQFNALYTAVGALRSDLENQIDNTAPTALQVAIVDGPGIFAATNVEDALLEVMSQLNTLTAFAGVQPGGIEGSIQFNSSSEFEGSSALVWDSGLSSLGINGALQVESIFYANDLSKFAGNANVLDNVLLVLGTGDDSCLTHNTAQTVDTLILGLATESRSLLIMERGDHTTNMGHAQQTNPTIFIHSADAADTTQWLSFAHDQTDGVINVGSGLLKIGANLQTTGQFVGASPPTSTPSGTTETLNWNTGNGQILDLADAAGDVTLTLTNPLDRASYLILVIQDAAVARDLIWPGTVLWAGGITPVISTVLGSKAIVSLFWDGSNYYGNIGQEYS